MTTFKPSLLQEVHEAHRHCRASRLRVVAACFVVLSLSAYSAYALVLDARNRADLSFGRGFQECMTQFKEP